MKTCLIAATAVCLAFAATSHAQAPADDADQGEQAVDTDDPYAVDAVRCRRVALPESRIRRTRVCMTNAQWTARNEETRRDAVGLLDRTTVSRGAVCDGC